MDPNNALIQSTSVDLLQAIVARGEIELISVQGIEAAVVGKLYYCIHTSRLNLQNKLLHLLHSLISASTAFEDIPRRAAPVRQRPDGTPEISSGTEGSQDLGLRYPVNPLLIQTLVDGIATQTNRPVLQHWLDFILMAVPQFQPTLQAVVSPLNDCICRQLSLALEDLLKASSKDGEYASDMSSTATDAELIMLLNGLERLILLSLAYTSEANATEEEPVVSEKSPQENSGLLGYVSNVFSSDSAQPEEQLTVCFVHSDSYQHSHHLSTVAFSWIPCPTRRCASTVLDMGDTVLVRAGIPVS